MRVKCIKKPKDSFDKQYFKFTIGKIYGVLNMVSDNNLYVVNDDNQYEFIKIGEYFEEY